MDCRAVVALPFEHKTHTRRLQRQVRLAIRVADRLAGGSKNGIRSNAIRLGTRIIDCVHCVCTDRSEIAIAYWRISPVCSAPGNGTGRARLECGGDALSLVSY